MKTLLETVHFLNQLDGEMKDFPRTFMILIPLYAAFLYKFVPQFIHLIITI